MSISALQQELSQASVVIKPQVQQLGAVGGFDQKTQAIQLGEQAARAALPQIKSGVGALSLNKTMCRLPQTETPHARNLLTTPFRPRPNTI